MTRIAFCGVGTMGRHLVRHLVAAGHDVRVFDPVPAAMEHGLQVVPGNDTPRQNMFNIPQQSAAGSILGGLGELSGIGAFRGLRRLDECGGGLRRC